MIRDRVRQGLRAGGFAGATATMTAMCAAHVAASPPERREEVIAGWVQRWSSTLLRLFAIRTVVHGAAPPPTKKGERGRLIVANHRSAIDIGVMLSTFGGRMVSRADLSQWPVVGAAAKLGGTIFVDRADARSGMVVMRAMQKHLEAGDTVTIFPEGTTFEGDEVRPFHGGAFIAAARARAEVLPVGLAYPSASGAAFVGESFMSHLGRMAMASSPTCVGVAVGAPILAEGKKAAELTKLAEAAVQAAVHEARAACGP
ncbi:MAG: 1-acyl-sn-glycerol-3-phosphate acyltransferase [Labilithrix sp.]|nr:1-acyl-sn-glycerol-3-phosphate acyltransferase [Labilithrix sp.]MCW5814563.1 1-acyl-sn-glycerol-3-phosphate acyltransferase [Labilithrix sp.]